jgi:hypothetical protein
VRPVRRPMRQWPNVMLGGRTLKAFRWSAIDAAEPRIRALLAPISFRRRE